MRKQDGRFNEYPSKNLLINGGFDVWQRGNAITSTTTTAFGADRWFVRGAGGTTVQTNGNATLNNEWIETCHMKFTGLTFSTFLSQKVESVKVLAAKKATVSFYIRTSVPVYVQPVLIQNFGTGGSPTPTKFIQSTGEMLAAGTWTKIERTFDIPSVLGSTFGTFNNDYLGVQIKLSATSADDPIPDSTVEITRCQLEEGSVATEFERLPIGLTEMLCKRYYQTGSFNLPVFSSLDTSRQHTAPRAVAMRASPTETGSTNTGATLNISGNAVRYVLISTGNAAADGCDVSDYTAEAEL